MDDITRKKLTDAFGPAFPEAVDALVNLWRSERAAEREEARQAGEAPCEPRPFKPREFPPLIPLVSEEGFDLIIRLKRNAHGVYEAHSSTHYNAPTLIQAIYLHTRGRNPIEALTRLAPQLGEAIETAESIDECEQLNRRYAEEIPS